MNRQSNNQRTPRRFFALAIYCLSALLVAAQTANANEPFDFSSKNFSLENMLNANFLSPQSVFVVNTTGDQNDQTPGDGFCNDGAGNCSLRAAIQEANASSGAQVIDFNIPGSCGQTISPTSKLPDITDSVTIDGYSQQGALPNTAATNDNAVICVMLNGANATVPAFVEGLTVNAVNTTIRGLAIGNFTDTGVAVNANGGIVEGNFIGTNQTRSASAPNRLGVSVYASNVRVGGTTLGSRNIVAYSTNVGIALGQAANSTMVQNNYVALNARSGISLFRASNNLIGGATAAARNVIFSNGTNTTGGFDGSGVYIYGDTNLGQAPNNTIQGNYIGINGDGNSALGNSTNGVQIFGATNTTVTGNVVSGNTIDGIGISGNGATGNVVKGNIVGLDYLTSAAVGNGRDGISIYQVGGNTIGGTSASDGNTVGGNGQYGIQINGNGATAENNLVQGNFIGVGLNGVARPQPGGIAVLAANNNTIGGTTSAARNIVAGNTNFGIAVASASGNTVSGNYVGILPTTSTLSNNRGIALQDATNNTVGGTATGAGNVISGNNIGVRLVSTNSGTATSGNQITGNLIGTTPDGSAARGNAYGIATVNVSGSNTIGGTTAAARNIISGNTLFGVNIESSANIQVVGNYIGTKPDGATALPNQVGVSIYNGSNNNTVGGTATGAGNVISGNGDTGVSIFNNASANSIQGNIIGLKADGSTPLPNASGIKITTAANANIVGGTAANAGNVISGNTSNGILISGGASSNFVQGNKIGTDANGTTARPNSVGILISQGAGNDSTINNTVGGTTVGARNIISGNTNGIQIFGANTTGTTVAGNYIGTDASGTTVLGNLSAGVDVESPNTTVGGATSDSRNVISGQAYGVAAFAPAINVQIKNNYLGTNAAGNAALGSAINNIQCSNAVCTVDSNVIAGGFIGLVFASVSGGIATNNRVGTNAAGTALLSNGTGIYISGASNVKIGEEDGGNAAPNVIAGSTGGNFGGSGILAANGSTNNLFRQNSIYDNAGLGIDLDNDGVTQNDDQDPDGGANHRQNYPIINNATTTISGSLNSTPNRSFRLEFFSSLTADPSGYGEGRTFLTNQTVTTDGSGNAVFSISNPQPLGSYISATATDLTTNDTSEFSGYKQTLTPTAVSFNGARARAFENGALVEWQTGRESDNLGFNVYRERGGKRELLNKNLVAGSALTASENLLSEQNYSWFDQSGDANSTYTIEAVDVNGTKQIYGAFPAETTIGKSTAANSATLNQLGGDETAATVTVEPTAKLAAKPTEQQREIQNQIAAGRTVKLTVRRAGIYRATAGELFANGLPANTSAANLRLFADGIEQPINVTGAESGVFDENSAIEFYGTGANTTETDARVYYLVAASNAGLRMTKADLQGSPSSADFYTATVERRDRTIYFSGLLNGDDENFFGAVVNNTATNQTINASQIAANGGEAELEISLQGITRNQHSVNVELNGSSVATLSFSEMERGTARISLTTSQLRDGENTVRLVANNPGDVSVVDFIRLTYPHRFQAENNRLSFSANGGQEITLGNFTSKNIRVFDVTDPNQTVELTARPSKLGTGKAVETETGDADLSGRNYSVRFTTTGLGTRRLMAVADAQMATAANVALDNPSNLNDRRNAASLLIVTRREFFDALRPLVELRRSQGLLVSLVDVADVYDEFSFGRKSTQAMKDFFKFAAKNWTKKPQFVLLAGDATYDPKGYLGNADADVIQTKLVDTDLVETASDEWLADFDNDGVGELVIGRLPARNAGEMSQMVAKIVNYEGQPARHSAAFVADVSDGYDFAAANRSIFSLLPQGFNVTDIRRENEDAKTQLLNAISGGQTIVSYAGHGSSDIWRGNLLTNADAAALTNGDRLPMFLMMTCLNGYFQNPAADSLSETLLKNPNGGAVAAWASTGTVTPDSQTELNRQFVQSLYGQNLTIGQAARAAKQATTNRTIRQTWTLFGDPTMRLK